MVEFTYDADGQRLTKEVNGVTHTYYYAGNKLLRETYGSNTLDFFYNADGSPYALKYNGTLYYYITNLQGDVMRVVDADGNGVARYRYDPYGNLTYSTGDLVSVNPLRYRGYYFDSETGFYYLQSRYYDPELGRFINADDFASTGQGILGHNMFAYCLNNPVAYQDSTGNVAILTTLGIMAIGGLIGSAVSAASSALVQTALTGTINWKSVSVSAVAGFVSGALAASPLGIGWQIVGGGVIGGVSYVADCYANDKPINAGEARLAVEMGMVSGLVGGPGANKNMVLTDAIEYMGKTAAREARRANQQYATKTIGRAIYYGSNIVTSSTWGSSIRFATGCGIANGVTGKASKANWYSQCITWEP